MQNILNDIIAALDNDAAFKSKITSIHAFEVYDVNTAKYVYTQLTNDKIKAQSRFELTAICSNYENAIAAIDAAKAVLLTKGDNALNDDILEITQNGGGSLYNAATETYHQKAIFIIKYKERG